MEAFLARSGFDFELNGFCWVCQREVKFKVDYFYAFEQDGIKVPNWRERLVCERCGLNNRLRAAFHMFQYQCSPETTSRIYMTEQRSLFFKQCKKFYRNTIGSEFFGADIPRGKRNLRGIRNEDMSALTFSDQTFDYVLSFDCLEHIPDFKKAFSECHRVLNRDGMFMFTVPFDANSISNLVRATVDADGVIRHLFPPEYHGDPINPEHGVLCYQTFGWEMIGQLMDAGFSDAYAALYYSREYCYLGAEQIIFFAKKP